MEEFFKQGLKVAVAYLERGERFESEMHLKLKSKGFDEETINKILLFLREKKFLNDEKVLKNVVDYRSKIKKEGKFKIFQHLMKRGMRKEEIDLALNDISLEDNFFSALSCLEKKFKKEFDHSKAYRFLGGRGYEYAVIESAINHFKGDHEKL